MSVEREVKLLCKELIRETREDDLVEFKENTFLSISENIDKNDEIIIECKDTILYVKKDDIQQINEIFNKKNIRDMEE